MPSLTPTPTKTLSRSERRKRGVVVRVLGAPPGSGFRLSEGTCVVGSSTSADVVVTDATVSRTHLELAVVDEGVAISDLGSRNGTYYCGQRIEKVVLEPRAVLTIGSARLSIEPDMLLGAEPYVAASYRGMIGGSPAMRELFSVLQQLEGSNVSVHVTGESGVGKDLVARALHEGSSVAGPLVTINCGAVSRELVSSELFGHKRGAFTGAHEARKGAFESANGGTLFLDEIGELPLDVQPMLLRVLESGEVRPVGGDRVEKVNVRVISATHRNLEGAVAEGRFREDLYYRLAVIKVHVPPLRERPDDVELLARDFARTAGVDLTPDAVTELRRRAWAGNVRELRNVVQAYSVFRSLPAATSHRDPRTEEALERFIRGIDVTRSYADLKDDLLERFQHIYLTQLIARTCGNQTAAAKLSGLDRTYLGRLLAKYKLSK